MRAWPMSVRLEAAAPVKELKMKSTDVDGAANCRKKTNSSAGSIL